MGKARRRESEMHCRDWTELALVYKEDDKDYKIVNPIPVRILPQKI